MNRLDASAHLKRRKMSLNADGVASSGKLSPGMKMSQLVNRATMASFEKL